MRETWVRFLGREDPLGKEMAIHSSTLARKIPWTEEPDRLHPMESQSRTQLSDFTSLHFSGVRKWLYCKADWASCFSLRLTGAIPAFLCSAFSVSSNDPSYIFPTLSVPVQMTSQQPLDCQQAYYAQSPYSRMYLPWTCSQPFVLNGDIFRYSELCHDVCFETQFCSKAIDILGNNWSRT